MRPAIACEFARYPDCLIEFETSSICTLVHWNFSEFWCSNIQGAIQTSLIAVVFAEQLPRVSVPLLLGGISIVTRRRHSILVLEPTLAQHLLNIRSPLRSIDIAEQDVHILQTAALGLLDKHEHKHAHGDTEHAKHEECPPADVVHRTRRDLSDDEIEEPLRRGAEADTVGSQPSGKDLASKSVAIP